MMCYLLKRYCQRELTVDDKTILDNFMNQCKEQKKLGTFKAFALDSTTETEDKPE